jgi:hypothetical protein
MNSGPATRSSCMPATDEAVLRVALPWVQKAESNLKTAAHTLKLDKACATDLVCFHAQQSVEKYLKALLVLHKQLQQHRAQPDDGGDGPSSPLSAL